MAAIDKIYGTYSQYKELKAFLENERPDAVKHLYNCWDWDSDPHYSLWKWDGMEHPISNFPTEVDIWLWHNCKLDWVLERLADQYGWTSKHGRVKHKEE